MEQTLGQDIENPVARRKFLEDNCDCVVEFGYMKPFATEQVLAFKEALADLSIEIADTENEMRAVHEGYKARLKPLKEQRADIVGKIKTRSEYVKEPCYRFTDRESKTTGIYNADGILVEQRAATADELQATIYEAMRAGTVPPLTGTNN